MAWKKAPQDLIDAFDGALPAATGVVRRQMFGYPCAFVNGNMFTGLHQHNLLVRLPDAKRAQLLKEPGAKPFEPMPGRVMREYVVVPPALVARAEKLSAWIDEAFIYARSLPPKAAKRAQPKRKA